MAFMKAERSRVSYADLERMPDDGRRFEIVDGELIDVTPAPSPLHQRVAKRLQRQLEAYFEGGGAGEVFNAPVDVILNPHDVFETDIVVVTNREQVTRRAIEGVPELVVEVLSPSSVKYDRVKKGNRYAALGIANYWILDPEARRLECFRWGDGAYTLSAAAEGHTRLDVPHFPGLTIDLAAIWAQIE
jgi:Uma2 family endonuclease